MVENFQTVVTVLQTGGPWAIMVIVGAMYWKKDQYINRLHQMILDGSIKQTEAMLAMKTAIDGLKDLLKELPDRLSK